MQSRRSSFQIGPMEHASHLNAVVKSHSAAVVQTLAAAVDTCCPSVAVVALAMVQAARRNVDSLHFQ